MVGCAMQRALTLSISLTLLACGVRPMPSETGASDGAESETEAPHDLPTEGETGCGEPDLPEPGDGDGDSTPAQICWSDSLIYLDEFGECDLGTEHACFVDELHDGTATGHICCNQLGEECMLIPIGQPCGLDQWYVCDVSD
jgi:hypothetical protein